MPKYDIRSVPDENGRNSIRSSHFEFLYTQFLESKYCDPEHSFNTVKPRRFCRSLPDAYSKTAQKLFYSMGCFVHSHFITSGNICKPCPLLPATATPADKNIYGEVYAVKKQRFDKMIARILKECSDITSIELMYECEWQVLLQTPGTDVYKFFNENKDVSSKTKRPPPFTPIAGKEVYMIDAPWGCNHIDFFH